RIREVNANQFAACLLLPRDLLMAGAEVPFHSVDDLKAAAATWGVSRQTLEIRLAQLGRPDLLPSWGAPQHKAATIPPASVRRRRREREGGDIAMGKERRHVVPNPEGGWDVKKPDADRASSHHDTQAQ